MSTPSLSENDLKDLNKGSSAIKIKKFLDFIRNSKMEAENENETNAETRKRAK